MRTIEEIIKNLKEDADYKYLNEWIIDTDKDILLKTFDLILKSYKQEKEQIIKELQSEDLDNLIKKYRRDCFGRLELYAGMPEYNYREGISDGINIAIEIVKRGGKECL